MIGELIKIKPEQLRQRSRKRSIPLWKRRWVHVLLLLMLLTATGGWVGMLAYIKPYRDKASALDMSLVAKLEQSSIIYDRNKVEIGRLANENRMIIPLADMPQNLIDCLTATEDRRFWEHFGVDYWGVARAAKDNLFSGGIKQGGSTLTQQLARNTYGLTERNVQRKLLEMEIAKRIEKYYTKKEILEHYLNRIPLGKGFYGVEAAAQGYFSKPAKELTLPESAVIVGLIKAPSVYSPLHSIENAKRERNKVYDRLIAEGKLKPKEAERMKKAPIPLKPSETARAAGYVQREVEEEVEGILNSMGLEGITGKGFKIYTTVDSDLQKAAEKSLVSRLTELENSKTYPAREKMADYTLKLEEWVKSKRSLTEKPQPGYLQGALLAVDNKTGGVLAMSGGRDFGQSQFNRVALSKRPIGTAVFPFIYNAAFEGTHFPGSRVTDAPMDNTKIMMGATTGTLGEWGAEGATGEHEQNTSLRRALIQGKNNCAARVGLEIGLKKFVDIMKRAGFGDVPEESAYLMGRTDVTLRDLCLAYTIFPNGGEKPASMWFVTRIENADGSQVYQRTDNPKPLPVSDPIATFMTHSCLEETLASDFGTAFNATDYGYKDAPLAGKTGTHINSTDLWFAGYNDEVTCAVWVGLDKKETVYPDAFSRHTALPVWVDVMNALVAKKPAQPVVQPPGMQLVELCAISGHLATDACLELGPDPSNPERQKLIKCSYMEYVRPETNFDLRCTFHSGEAAVDEAPPGAPVINSRVDSSVNLADATPLKIKAPVLIGKDPYLSYVGSAKSPDEEKEDDFEKEQNGETAPVLKAPDTSRPPLVPMVPLPGRISDTILPPSPGQATVD